MWHLLLFILILSNVDVNGDPIVPCFFIFGDSLYDVGNNNNLNTNAKANYPPYGNNFPQGPTGRFTNGRTITDFIAEFLGFGKYIPSFASALGLDILQGVNYASASSGIRDETGQHLGLRISLNNQLNNHETTISRMKFLLGDDTTASLLNRCLYTVGTGNNDYIANYLRPNYYNTSLIYDPLQYSTILIQQYSQQLRRLYGLGARKIAVFGVGPLGCIPASVTWFGTNGSLCVDTVNNMVELFNSKLIALVDDLNNELLDAKFIYISIYKMSFLPFKADWFFQIPPCCEVGANINTTLLCIPNWKSCNFKWMHLFWDAIHPSETANVVTATRSYHSLHPFDTYPTDIYHLALLYGRWCYCKISYHDLVLVFCWNMTSS